MLCDILFRNFRAKDYRRYIDLTKIHYRMKNGLYEKAPQNFLRDILQVYVSSLLPYGVLHFYSFVVNTSIYFSHLLEN
jgi:hypothetical protein